jgi:hypothetical protein
MYVPASELQQYKGQWMCPYCLMDSRDEDRRAQGGGEDSYLKSHYRGESCERCGRTLSIVYYYGGRRLCETCVESAKNEWGDVGGERPPMSMYRISSKRAGESKMLAFFVALFSEILRRLGIRVPKKKKKEAEIVAIKPKRKVFVPFAKPMKEGAIKDKEQPKKKKEKKEKKESKSEISKTDSKAVKEKEKKKEKFKSFKKE